MIRFSNIIKNHKHKNEHQSPVLNETLNELKCISSNGMSHRNYFERISKNSKLKENILNILLPVLIF